MGANFVLPKSTNVEQPKVSLGDSNHMKRVLDDALVKCFEEHAPFEEDYRWGNVKLTIMVSASIAALVAQFYPLPFPENRLLLGVCVVIYFALSGVLQYMSTFIDKDIVYSGKLAGTPTGGAVAVLRTSLPKASPLYTITLEYPRGTPAGSITSSIGRYFDSAGFLAPRHLSSDVKALADAAGKGGWGSGGAGGGDTKKRQ